MRRGDTRRETSARVTLRPVSAPAAAEIQGWSLNESRGGMRVIVEAAVELGGMYEVSIDGAEGRPGQIVWLQNEPDGMILGIAFTDVERGSVPPPPPDASRSE
jgi:PilZ domain